ncbi:hypothetical protein AB5J52_05185 [Streptomyces sp. R39]|uniref:Uncharacterized protein n=1 Tax=Streptomyces sp. R39 TaxID=3238631 RepID=A0AB39QHA5_9ACTN
MGEAGKRRLRLLGAAAAPAPLVAPAPGAARERQAATPVTVPALTG